MKEETSSQHAKNIIINYQVLITRSEKTSFNEVFAWPLKALLWIMMQKYIFTFVSATINTYF